VAEGASFSLSSCAQGSILAPAGARLTRGWVWWQVAVAGRTAGRSSIFSVLFRLRPVLGGGDRTGGAGGVSLQALRSRLSLMPQAPLLLKGSVRYGHQLAGNF